MNKTTKAILTALMIALLAAPGFANLVDEVDKLTPEQAELFQKKLEQKKFEGLQKNTRIGGGIQVVNATSFTSAFPGLPQLHSLVGGQFDVRQPVSEKILVGGSFNGWGNYLFSESSPRIYQDMLVLVGSAQLVLEWRLVKTNNFIMSVTPGGGFLLGGFTYNRTDDNAQTTYSTNRWGSGLCTSLALDLSWKLADEWGMGIGVSAFSGKVGGMRKIISGVDSTTPELDMTGTMFRISGTKAF